MSISINLNLIAQQYRSVWKVNNWAACSD